MIIGITGYGYSGASAYTQVLKEFEGIQSYSGDTEFQIVQEPDGLLDLMYGIVKSRRRLHCNAAIHRFIRCVNGPSCAHLTKMTKGALQDISRNYINDLVKLTWDGRSNYDPEDVRHWLDRKSFFRMSLMIRTLINKLHLQLEWPPSQKRYFSFVDEEVFLARTRQFVDDLLTASGIDPEGNTILEQVFNCTDPLSGSEFFDHDLVSMVVERDPRDIFILTNVVNPHASRFMPNKRKIEPFIEYYKLLHYNHVEDPRVKYLQYEDLIYQYHKTIQLLEEATGRKHIAPKSIFKPEISINNTQLYKKFPQFSKEIQAIERQLEEYLYDFDSAAKGIDFQPVESRIF